MGETLMKGIEFSVDPNDDGWRRNGKIALAFQELQGRFKHASLQAILPLNPAAYNSRDGIGSTDDQVIKVLSLFLPWDEINSFPLVGWRKRIFLANILVSGEIPDFSFVLPRKKEKVGLKARPISKIDVSDMELSEIRLEYERDLLILAQKYLKSRGRNISLLFPATAAALDFTLEDIIGDPHWQGEQNLKQLVQEGKLKGSIYYLGIPFLQRLKGDWDGIPRKFGVVLMAEREWNPESLEAIRRYQVEWDKHTSKGISQFVCNIQQAFSAGAPNTSKRS